MWAVVPHPLIWIFKQIQIGGKINGIQQSQRRTQMAFMERCRGKAVRELGVCEKAIEQLREHDWAIFNADRRFYQRLQETGTYLEEVAEAEQLSEIKTVDDFLDSIENEQLYQVLITVDKLTLAAAVMKIQGYSTREIARHLGITEKSVYRRMDRLKEKIKKFYR